PETPKAKRLGPDAESLKAIMVLLAVTGPLSLLMVPSHYL
ncbi:hypothetical protein LEMLEM_LOCUS7481, partial [Lemmus lemmus]